MRHPNNSSILVLALAMALGACGAQGTEQENSDRAHDESLAEQLDALDHDLKPGARGEVVQALHEYLERYGYFPNEALARSYPAWRPIVSKGPTDVTAYDASTRAAVRVLQANAGLEATGLVDEPTRALLRAPRCGVPDGITRLDPSQKFAQSRYGKWTRTSLTWKFLDTTVVDIAKARAATAAALATWAEQTNMSFTEVTGAGTADIELHFEAMDGPGATGAWAAEPSGDDSKLEVKIDDSEPWSVQSPTPAGKRDLQTVILHELGHALGLSHAGAGLESAIMFPTYLGPRRTLGLDDKIGISTLYDVWEALPGLAKDVSVGADGTAWIVGTNDMGGGNFGIYRWNGTGWIGTTLGAVRIAVEPTGVPWVVNAAGQIFRRTSSSTSSGLWIQLQGLAKDVGIGQDGSVWIVGTNDVGNGDFGIYKWNGAGWTGADGGGARIAVGPTGIPWIVNAAGKIYRRTSNSTSSGTWQNVLGFGNDIGISDGNYVWLIGPNSVGGAGDFGIRVWNEQTGIVGGAYELGAWLVVGGGARNIAVGPNARPWIVNSAGQIYRAKK